MKYAKILSFFLAAVLLAAALGGCSKKEETTVLQGNVEQVSDADDTDTSVVAPKEKSNIVVLTDLNGNKLSLYPIMDVQNTTMIAGYVKSGLDKSGKALEQGKGAVGKAVAIYTDASSGAGVQSVLSKDGKTVFVDFFTDDNSRIIAIESADDGKYYKVKTTISEGGNIYMQLAAGKDGKPIEVEVKKENQKTKIVEKSSGKVVSDQVNANGRVEPKPKDNENKGGGNDKTPNKDEKKKDDQGDGNADKVIAYTDYSELADVTIELTKNSTAAVKLEEDSPVKVDLKNKAYVQKGVLYLKGNGDYYIRQAKNCPTWYGKIVVELGDYGLARVRMAGVTISSQESTAIAFMDTDSQIDDTDVENNVLISYKPVEETKKNPNAILSFVDGTTNTLRAEGNTKKGSGTVYSQCKLSIKGHGTADIYAKNKNAIHTARSVGIQNATLNLTAEAGKGIRSKNMVDIEEHAKITVHSTGDAVRCVEFMMDTDVKSAGGGKDKSTGSTVQLYPKSGETSPTSGDGIDADDSVIVRVGKLDIDVTCTKDKYGIKVRRVNNEEFIKVIQSENIKNIEEFKKKNAESENYADVVLNEKEYAALLSVADRSPTSADYQGIRKGANFDDTLRFTGGTTKAVVQTGRNTTVKNSANSIGSISAYASIQRTININGYLSGGDQSVKAVLYAGSDVTPAKKHTVTFGAAGKRNPEISPEVDFNNKVGYVTDTKK